MKAITLRNLPAELERAILKRARHTGVSINKTVIALLEESVGPRKQNARHHELDDLCGAWSNEEAKRFDEALAEQRTIDSEMWE
ncbi:MAG TPA: hypothetical protein VGC53_14025 [Vicinamibacteria bacterium]|jgi:DNA polymerase III delta subunit